jgi:hypothetical protein
VTATALAVPLTAFGDGPAWWDPLNITGSAKPKATARKPAAKKDSWINLPGFGTDTAKKPAARKNEPSTLAKMNTSTKKFFSGAADVLTPWDNKKPATSKRPTGYGGGGSAKSVARGQKKEADKGNILTSWWKDKEPEPKRPKTVPDFISGERP